MIKIIDTMIQSIFTINYHISGFCSLQSAVQVEFGPELTSSLKACPENTLPYAAIIGDAKPKRPSDFLTSDNVPDLQSLVKKIHVYELKSEWSDSLRRW